jgi:hypothetical protein
MNRRDRTLAFAAAASLALHVAALGGLPRLDRGEVEPAPPPPLQAQLAAARPVPAPVAEPQKQVPQKKPIPAQRKRAPTAASRAPADAVAAAPAVPPLDPGSLPADFAPDAVADSAPAEAKGDAPIAASGREVSGAAETARVDGATASPDFGPPAAYPIRSLKAVYDLYYSSASPDAPVGRVTYTWSSDGQQYVAESVTEGVGLVRLFYSGKFAQRSEGRIGADGLVPEVYTLRRGRAEVSDMARFDWSAATVSLESKGQTRVIAIPRGAQDPLSAQHQFYFVQPLAASGQFRVADGRKLRAFWYEVVGEELIETALGVVSTIHMRRADSDDSTADVWVDPRRSYLPVKIHATDRKGRVIEQRIRFLEVEPVATAAVELNSNR